MAVLFLFILILISLLLWRRYHQKHANLKFVYTVYELRDKLRNLAIKGKIDSNSLIFDFYDKSFSLVIKESYYLTFFRVLLLSFKHQGNKKIECSDKKIEEETQKNPELIKLRENYLKALISYFHSQHYATIYFFFIPIISAIIGGNNIAKKINDWMCHKVLIYPETSESNSFAGQLI